MNAEKKRETREFCLGRVDEAFAEIFFIFGGEFRAGREILPDASDVGAVFSPRAEDAGFGEAEDFDLSSRKRRGLEDSDPGERVGTSVSTSFSTACSAEAGRSSADVDLSTTAAGRDDLTYGSTCGRAS